MAPGPDPLPSRLEPSIKRAVAFVDGQNLFNAAKQQFGYHFPNYDIRKLASSVCGQQGWILAEARFYTGIPHPRYDWDRNQFWQKKLSAMGRQGIRTFARQLVYRRERLALPGGAELERQYSQEKGIDVRIAVDMIRLAFDKAYDVAVIFSQDQDLSEAAMEIREIAAAQNRWIQVASAYPFTGQGNTTAIGRTVAVRIDRGTYDACIDPVDYRPGRPNSRSKSR
jgi:uncharacterized LabA/DUF88 family protein